MLRKVCWLLFCFIFVTNTFGQEQVYKGELSEGDEVNEWGSHQDTYTIEVPAGKLLIASLYSEDFDTYLTIITPNGEKVTSDDFLSLSYSQVELVSDKSAAHTVLVTSGGLLGNYRLKLSLKEGKPSEEFLLNQEAEKLISKSHSYRDQGEFILALEVLDKALSIEKKLGYRFYEGNLLYLKGLIYQQQGKLDISLEHFEAFLQIIHQEDDLRTKGWELNVIYEISKTYLQQLEQQELDLDLENFQEALALARELDNEEEIIEAIINIADSLLVQGFIYWENGQYEQALVISHQALRFYQQINVQEKEGMVLLLEGRIYSDWGQLDQGLQSYKQALEIYQEMQDKETEKSTLYKIAVIYRTKEELGKALENLEQALVISRKLQDKRSERTILDEIGFIHYNKGQLDKALEIFKQVLEINHELQDRADEQLTLTLIGLIYQQHGELDLALESHRQALEIVREVHDRAGEGNTLSNIALVYNDLGELDLALENYQQALEIMREVHDRAGEGTTLNDIALVYNDLGELDLALENYQQALEIMREVHDRAGEGTTLNDIALVYNDLGELDLALENYQQALEIMREVHDRAGEGTTLNDIALVYNGLGELDLALENYQQALEIMREVHNRAGEGTTLHNIGGVYNGLGELDLALENYQQALEIRREVEDRAGEGNTLHNIALVYHDFGELDLALENYHQSLEISREVKDRAGEGTTLNGIGFVHAHRGELDLALENYQKALEISREVKNRAGEGNALNSIGRVYDDRGELDLALKTFEQALEIMREVKDPIGEFTTLHNIAFVHQRRGELDLALKTFEQALEMMRETQYRTNENTILHNIAEVYHDRGELDLALEAYQQALEISREAKDRFGEGNTLNSIALIYNSRGELDLALENHQQVLEMMREVQYRAGEGTVLNNIALVYHNSGELDLALENYQKALEISREVQKRSSEFTALRHIAFVYQDHGKLDLALETFQQAIIVQETIRDLQYLEETKTFLLTENISIYQNTINLAIGLEKTNLAFSISEKAKSRSFLDQLGNTLPDVLKSADPELLAEFEKVNNRLNALDYQLHEAFNKGNDTAIITSQINELEKQYNRLLENIKLQNPEYVSLITIDPLDLEEVQNLLESQQTLISYFLTEEKSFAFVITKDSFETINLEVSEEHLTQTLQAFHESKQSTDIEHLSYSQEHLANLYNGLIKPLETKNLLTSNELIIASHSILHSVPFSALYNGEKYLSEEYQITHLPSASVLPFIQNKLNNNPNQEKILSMSYPRPLDSRGLTALTGAAEEARNLAELYGTEPFIGSRKATEENLRTEVAGKDIVLLASHGILNDESPLRSHIVLAPSGENSDTDGLLTVQEVYGLDLTAANLVVLSACETAGGKLSSGDDLVGLTRAFIYAGTPSLVATLWAVNDESTKILMVQFHKNIKDGMNYAEALGEAQAYLRSNPKYTHPYYWAPFVLVGSKGL